MRNIFIVGAIFAAGSLFADVIGFVDYELPEVAKTWEKDSSGSEEMEMVAFTAPETEEAFVVTFSPGENPSGAIDRVAASLQNRQGLSMSRLEKDENSLFCEYAQSYRGETLYVAMRLFITPEGLVTLTHATNVSENPEDDVWLHVLQNAKIIN